MSYGFYIYYRVRAEIADELRLSVIAMQQDIHRQTGVMGKLHVKADEPLLWMETYDGIDDRAAFSRVLDQAIAANRFTELLAASARMTEVFTH